MAARETTSGKQPSSGESSGRANGSTAEGPRDKQRKDRLIQTRVPRDLESTLKAEAKRRRLTVSHLIRNVLEDTFQLVDGVVADVDQIVSDSVSLARNVSRNVSKLAASGQGEPRPRTRKTDDEAEESTADATGHDHVYAWNEVVLHKPTDCARCGETIERGEPGFVGLTDQPEVGRPWLCRRCVSDL
jgi:hypothetical protein